MSFHAGLDIGASATKAVLLDGEGNVRGRALRNSGADFAAAAKACFDEVTQAAGVDSGGVEHVVATGYGRRSSAEVRTRPAQGSRANFATVEQDSLRG